MPLALFDLDNTLVDRRRAFPAAVADFCRTLGYGAEIEAWMHAELAARAAPDDLARMRRTFDLSEPAASLWTAYVDRMAAAITCRPAVREALAGLRASGWTLGVVTNGASDIQRAKLRAAGLAELVDGVAVSGDIDARKPDAKLFRLAADRCRADLVGATMTGDDPIGDIGGGHAAGLRTIWLRGRPWPAEITAPHHTVDDVLDAVAILLDTRQE
ncbi:HAD family hydrolase [Streptomyces litchfieldiae]|uniref:HAD family hydrolase n=1 Tax=Streptomyces litchfieldiae TaxID=3075543 RepID=A0ABU2N0X1_9ACTN|nr:HAD family hydrolase [Streptomyces sp. DSM 44938]MDT0347557.1 HAD family hydrolase [Streptomyces sp. DSM 44938]